MSGVPDLDAAAAARRIIVGKVTGPYGVRGWVNVRSYTVPVENILMYSPWQLRIGGQWVPISVTAGRRHGKGCIAELDSCTDRDAAARFSDAEVAVARGQLPPTEEGEYYWADLVGMSVATRDGANLGRVARLLETGANDVLVIEGERERLIPFVLGDVVLDVDLAAGAIRVDWDPEF